MKTDSRNNQWTQSTFAVEKRLCELNLVSAFLLLDVLRFFVQVQTEPVVKPEWQVFKFNWTQHYWGNLNLAQIFRYNLCMYLILFICVLSTKAAGYHEEKGRGIGSYIQ